MGRAVTRYNTFCSKEMKRFTCIRVSVYHCFLCFYPIYRNKTKRRGTSPSTRIYYSDAMSDVLGVHKAVDDFVSISVKVTYITNNQAMKMYG
jgi:hypothetical protein